MSRSHEEVEVKLSFESAAAARERLHKRGARLLRERHFEDNIVFDREHGALRSAGELLRLRRAGDRALLTFKAPVPGERRHKVRIEHETVVEDPEALCRLLQGLGFRSEYRYQKYRTVFELGGVQACLDETPLGCFVELEGEGDAIDRNAAALGFGPERYIRESYRELHVARAREQGRDPGDLVFHGNGVETAR